MYIDIGKYDKLEARYTICVRKEVYTKMHKKGIDKIQWYETLVGWHSKTTLCTTS